VARAVLYGCVTESAAEALFIVQSHSTFYQHESFVLFNVTIINNPAMHIICYASKHFTTIFKILYKLSSCSFPWYVTIYYIN